MRLNSVSPWNASPEQLAKDYETDVASGLTTQAAGMRLEEVGPNQIAGGRQKSLLTIFLSQFADLMILLLAAAAGISALSGEWTDTILIGLIVLANAGIGAAQEWKAEKAIEALKRMSQPLARVWRDGQLREVPSRALVPGDVIEVKAGDLVPADARVIKSAELEVDESPLTGESLPVGKTGEELPSETALPDRTSMIHSGTSVAQGRAKAVVTATGQSTELGRIAKLLESADAGQTPLQQRLAKLNRWLAFGVIVVSLVVFVAGVLREPRSNWSNELFSRMLLTAVSLAVAAIPEGLPAVITVTLAIGSQRMARRNAIIRKLSAVETLGSVDVICSDKTGTLTQNRMAVADLLPFALHDNLKQLLEAAVLCNDTKVGPAGELVGSATESALVVGARDRSIDLAELRRWYPRISEIPFSSRSKQMVTLHRLSDGGRRLIVKGAPDRILPGCTGVSSAERDAWLQRTEELALTGRRVLAVAARDWNRDEQTEIDLAAESQHSIRLLGLIGLIDPIRPEVKQAIAECKSAGIRPVMITGDHPGTARSIAEELGLFGPDDELLTGVELESMSDEELGQHIARTAGFARVSPEHKLRIVRAHQLRGRSVAMTGDGVNDAPALKQADIGVAMGITGTDVSKEAAAMILADDDFATIVAAIEEGRVVYDNIRKFVTYLLTSNTSEVLVLLGAILGGLPLPLLPVHLLWINLVTDGLPALALGFEPAERNLMQRQPRRRDESIFAGGLGLAILAVAILMAIVCLSLFYGCLAQQSGGNDLARARTMTFLTLSTSQLFIVLSFRSFFDSVFQLGFWSNYRLAVAVAAGMGLQLAIIYVPMLRTFFHAVPLSAGELALVIALSAIPFAVVEIWKASRSAFRVRKHMGEAT